MKHKVCERAHIKPGEMEAFTVGKTSIVVIHAKDGEIYALRNVCPHKGPALSDGMIDGTCSTSEPGDYILEKDGKVLKCPWHNWEFDIETGCSLFDPKNVRVKSYEVTVQEGHVFVHM